jgi:HK97 family phage major capsid protein
MEHEMSKTDFPSDPVAYRKTLVDLAGALCGKTNFTKEDSSRVSSLLDLSREVGTLSGEHRTGPREKSPEHRALNGILASRNGYLFGARSLAISDPTISLQTSVLTAQQYYRELCIALQTVDSLFDADVCTLWESPAGSPVPLPGINVLDAAAVQEAEGQVNLTDATIEINAVGLPAAPTFRTPVLLVSRELFEDTAFDIAEVLTMVHALQFGLGIGPSLVAALLAASKTGTIASGSASSSGNSDETGGTSVGWADLIALRKIVQPVYRLGPKCGFLMNDNTLASLDSQLDKSGRPIFPQNYNEDGRRVLQGFPVFISPSMPDIGPGNTPIAFGNFRYFVTRIVAESIIIRVLQERYALSGQIGYFAKLRCNGALLGCVMHGSPAEWDGPVALLHNMASEG